ncbi:phage portal protein family protein [Dactylosporangium sp. CA-052675]|uniref:phage portal protein family protein n=1 Tax=Dactylosporangium sp. CA-052675 TaxID=3239927 RepID=UPI003D94DFCA
MQMEIELPGIPSRVQAAATKPAVATRSEIGYAQAVNSQWWLYEDETTPELQWPQSVAVYDAMRRTDAQVNSVLEAVTLPVRRTPWRIDPNGARATVVKFVANDLGLPIVGKDTKPSARTKGKFSWPEHLRMALLELVYGHMYFEQVYSVNDAGTEAHLKKLAPRMPKTISEVEVAADGGLVSITQWWTATNRQPQKIPVDRLVAYVRNREGGNWLGQSVLRPAYKNWLIKDRLLRVQAQTVERNGMGIPLYKAQEGASEEAMVEGKRMATLWRAGEAAGSAVPFGADLVLRGVEGTLPDADVPIRYHDEQIARAVLAHFLNLGTQTGSWALGTTFADFFVFSLQTLAQQIADVTTQHVIEDLVDLNFGENEPAPRLVFDEIGSQQQATAQALKTLVDAGIIHPDAVLEQESRQQYGLPAADPATATPAPGAQAPTPPEPTPTGELSVAATRKRAVKARYDPGQLRDPNGEWGDGIPGPSVAKDALNLAGRIDLDPGEKLESSSRISDTSGDVDVNFAVVRGPDGADVRIGFIPSDGDSDRWKAANKGGTALLEPGELQQLRTDLAGAVTQARKAAAAAEREWAKGGTPSDAVGRGEAPVASGTLPNLYSDVRWDVYLNDDSPVSWDLSVGTVGSDGDSAKLDPKRAAKLLRHLDDIQGQIGPGNVQAAGGVDTHPGGEQLKHYWLYGEGAAKWDTFTELYHHLVKYLSLNMAKRTAANWFHERFGIWPGSDANRVKHGKPPRGKVVGPG